ncbi:phosphate transporter family-domain-containing protein [Haematococcus lacustris]
MSVDDPVMSHLKWLVVFGAFGSFLFGYGTGSNDVANAFGTSVGSRTLTLRQAVVIAAIFEFGGAMLLGRVSTSTIAGGIADIKSFQREPEFYAFGMVIAVTVSGIWNILASYLEFNVSATHSIIGSIMGFSLVFGGGDAVKWAVPDPSAFPPYKGVVPIILAWFISPIFTSIAAGLLFMALRMFVLRRQNGNTLAFWLLPFLVMLTVYICVFFVFTRGIKKTLAKDGDWDDAKSAWVTAIIAAGCGVLTAVVVLPILKSRANRLFKDHIPVTDATGELGMVDKAAIAGRGNEPSGASFTQDGKAPARNDNSMMPSYDANGGMVATGYHMMTPEEREAAIHKARLDAVEKAKAKQLQRDEEEKQKHQEHLAKLKAKEAGEKIQGPGFMGTLSNVWNKTKKALLHGTSVDVHEVVEDDPLVAAIHANAEHFDPRVEFTFSYLQGKLTSSVTAPVWIVLIGAIGLVIGLATYGYNVTRSMGVRLAKLSPSRGFCAELSTALVILVCSQYGLPTSSSQVITGGIIGVGLTEGTMGVNWRFFALQFSTWVSTLFVCGLGTAAIFALGVYSPGIVEGAQVELYEDRISNLTQHLYRSVNTELVPFRGAAAAGTIPTLSNATWTSLNRSTLTNAAAAKAATGTTRQTVPPEEVLGNLYRALALVQQTSVSTVGQARVFPGATNVCNGPAGPDAPAACRAPRLLPAAFNSTFPI